MKELTGENLRVNVDRIPEEGLTIEVGGPADRFPALKDATLEGEARFDSSLEMEIRLRWVGRFVEASGRLETSVRLICSRCLRNFPETLSLPFEATYSEEPQPQETSEKEAEILLTTDSIDLYPFHGREIDLLDAIQEQVLLALPMRPLCREECKGLCPRCGEDLNKGACECNREAVDPRLSVLSQLKLKK